VHVNRKARVNLYDAKATGGGENLKNLPTFKQQHNIIMARSFLTSRSRVGWLWGIIWVWRIRLVSCAVVGGPNESPQTVGPAIAIHPFPMSHIALMDDDFVASSSLNHEYLLMLDPDNLLFNFR